MIDTGSSACVFKPEDLERIGIFYHPEDVVQTMIGIGGDEQVITKHVKVLSVGHLQTRDFAVQVGAVDYGYGINGILGFDFLRATNTVLHAGNLTLE